MRATHATRLVDGRAARTGAAVSVVLVTDIGQIAPSMARMAPNMAVA